MAKDTKSIVLTGGGSSGHVTPNIALLPALKRAGYFINYIGSQNGIEKQLIEREGVPYYSISTGKLRRYFDLKNFSDAFRVVGGLGQAYALLGRLKPDVVFSKGGFVSCPVVWAAWLRRIPVVIHESDMTPGLTNKLSIPFAKNVCYTFPESEAHISSKKGVRTGMPIREGLLAGDRVQGAKMCGFRIDKPVIMVIGGSLGSEKINNAVRGILDTLLKNYNVCHICGKGNLDPLLEGKPGYRQFEYINEEQPHIYALADMVVSRAGATVLFELLALKKPNLLIPLSRAASRGDQILNAASFEKQGFSMVLQEDKLDSASLEHAINELRASGEKYKDAMMANKGDSGVSAVIKILEQASYCR
ncbi:MAG TPA: undecaprenyldiphospho-muramoylpentapeptide beta-N-acetylglucosaminyltransferase [Clostridia bacterium]|nr:undecaprenyldiphospho-muramoylpentapeptide beta-N-acetylglucosaminyltransferase [Clostridia bacterium]